MSFQIKKYFLIFFVIFIKKGSLKYVFSDMKTSIGSFATTVEFAGFPVKLDIDLESQITWLPHSLIQNYSTFTNLTNCVFNYRNEIFKGSEWIGPIAIQSSQMSKANKSVSLSSFNFYTSSQTYSLIIQSSLSFSYKITKKEHSIITKLYEENLITKREFTLNPKIKYDLIVEGEVFYGEAPSELYRNKNSIKVFVIEGDEPFWNFRFSQFYYYIDGKKMGFNLSLSHLSTKNLYILMPNEIFDVFMKTYLKKLFDSDICKISTLSLIVCDSESKKSFEDIYFNFNGNILRLTYKELCFKSTFGCYFLLQRNKDNKWIFGTRFLKYFSTKFDYEEKAITFFSDKLFIYQEIININKIKTIFLCDIFINLFGLIVIGYIIILMKTIKFYK